ncbi:MAG: hypothetical protein ABIQ02_13185, partial [Saprospiraceae bacterium]
MNGTSLKYISCFILFFFLAVFSKPVYAQISPTQARELLANRGVNEDTLRARLIKKGYNPEQIRPEQVTEFQAVVIQTIKEIEQDQQRTATSGTVKTNNPDINPAQKEQVQVPPPASVAIPTVPAPSKGTPIYGQEIFRNNSIAVYQKADEITPPDDYILGPGDKIGIVAFGRSQFDEILEVGADGFVQPKGGLPRILLKGLKLANAKELLF